MSGLRVRIGGDGPVVAETDRTGWRLIVHGRVHESGLEQDGLHSALRQLALRDSALAGDAFGVVCNCIGAWEDEYTDDPGEHELTFEYWMERIETGMETAVDDDGELYFYA